MGLKILICQSGQQWRFAPSVHFVGSSRIFFSFLCVVLCVYHIYGAGAYRVHLIMGSFYLVCFKIIRRMQQSFKTSAA